MVLATPAQAPLTRIVYLAHQGIGYTTIHVNRVNWAIFMIRHPNLLASHAMPLAVHAADRLAQIVFLVKPNYIWMTTTLAFPAVKAVKKVTLQLLVANVTS